MYSQHVVDQYGWVVMGIPAYWKCDTSGGYIHDRWWARHGDSIFTFVIKPTLWRFWYTKSWTAFSLISGAHEHLLWKDFPFFYFDFQFVIYYYDSRFSNSDVVYIFQFAMTASAASHVPRDRYDSDHRLIVRMGQAHNKQPRSNRGMRRDWFVPYNIGGGVFGWVHRYMIAALLYI